MRPTFNMQMTAPTLDLIVKVLTEHSMLWVISNPVVADLIRQRDAQLAAAKPSTRKPNGKDRHVEHERAAVEATCRQ
jgi:hypothetical protein